MKVETIKKTMSHFCDIDRGECCIVRSYPYMKISYFNDRAEGYINAINLTNGACTFIDENTEVKKVYAKLVIEE